jgi:hypothetical protein
MMGYQPPPQENLFSMNVALENRVRKDHPLRNIKTLIDFNFTYKEVEEKYGSNGNTNIKTLIDFNFTYQEVEEKYGSNGNTKWGQIFILDITILS